MKEHKHKWIIAGSVYLSIFGYLVVYYICEDCNKYKIVNYDKLK